MKQIRIIKCEGFASDAGPRFSCDWMEASLNNRWFLKTRLAEALQVHGADSYRIEIRDKQVSPALSIA